MTRISVRGVAVVSATAVTAVGAVVGAAAGSEGGAAVQTVDVASATLLADAPTGAQAQNVSDGIGRQADAQQVSADTAAKKAAEEAARLKAAADAQAKADSDKAAKEAETKAAEDKAAADKAAADKAAKDKAAKQQQNAAAAQSSLASIPAGSVQDIARQIIGDDTQFQCFSQIVKRESGWNYTATNASSGAYGLVQALPGSKMASAGADWRTNPATQIKWGLSYMNSRYGSPCGAWSFWQAHNWY
ncbi:transglycosylase SLT domain-containing protein [Kitasatospora sp. NA04385]|uniref:aggregation-promoting factor C-terminal-like domain-containing protein n=1 Tax=Kitasatospora sp. NA04385 TaxID=2742135 RepID=UPI0015900859|nr:transglycosylase SLT domain-containing protein [Kitasatospora sp. NA04385]QKW18313.1 transglycosylase SLT domain-containing protein [Kitasatospora sp. NA04385]